MVISNTVREGVKLSTTGAVQVMLGGIVAAVVPPQVSILYKAAAYVGGLVVAWYTGEKLDSFIDQKLDDVGETIDAVKAMAAEAKKNKDNTEAELEA